MKACCPRCHHTDQTQKITNLIAGWPDDGKCYRCGFRGHADLFEHEHPVKEPQTTKKLNLLSRIWQALTARKEQSNA